MAGFPFHDLDAWIKELVSYGPKDPDPQSVTMRPIRAVDPDPQSVTPQRRSVVTLDQNGRPILDYPNYAPPRGMDWRRCENCKNWFPSKRSHAKTCSPKCRKALSRMERA